MKAEDVEAAGNHLLHQQNLGLGEGMVSDVYKICHLWTVHLLIL